MRTEPLRFLSAIDEWWGWLGNRLYCWLDGHLPSNPYPWETVCLRCGLTERKDGGA